MSAFYRVKDLIERHDNVIELAEKKLKRKKCAGHLTGHSDFFADQKFVSTAASSSDVVR